MSLFGRQDDESRPRTAEERERARLEREARRAAREGRPLPETPPAAEERGFEEEPSFDAAPPPPEEPHFDEEPSFEAAPPPAAEEPRFAEPPPASEEPRFAEDPRFGEVRPLEAAPPPAANEPDFELAEPPPHVEEPRFSEPLPTAAQPPVEEPLVTDEPGRPVEADREEEHVPPPVEEPEITSQPTEPFTAVPEEPEHDEPRIRRVGPAPAPATPQRKIPPLPDRVARYGDEGERPIGVRRVQRREGEPPRQPPAGGAGEGRESGGKGRRRFVALALLLVVVAALAYAANAVFQPFAGDGGQAVSIRIPNGSTAGDIGSILEREGVVDSATIFSVRARLSGQRNQLKAGTYRLREDMSYAAALDQLTEGPPAPKTVNVTVPEGLSRREAAPVVDKAGLTGSYLDASKRVKGFDPTDYGAPRAGNLEGFLFPATFELKPKSSARDLVAKQVDAFRENLAEVDFARAKRRNLSRYDVLIIASMVEREAQIAKERRLIAAVIHNRLREGMPLGIDATIRYSTRNWSRPLRVSELEADTPYNTRTRTGLPPTPIGNPGLASIQAAADPANVDYLFYVVKPCAEGEHAFSASDQEFERDRQAYERKRAELGGKSPTNC